jgi:RsiW-degrading membrane proteinase PrsW (M82 family)
MLLTVTLAIVVPIAFLYAIHWLDLYGSDRPRIVAQCFAWGLVAFLMSFAANRFCIDILGYSRQFVSTRTAPFVEEVFKSLILVWLLRKAKLTYFADGAIYGFASGIGFAVIENLRYIQLFPDNPFGLVIVRDFSSALAHGTATAMTGIALGGFVLSSRRHHGLLALIVGLTGAMGLHYAWNNFAYYSRFDRFTTEWIMVGVGFAGVICVSATIIWGMQRERRHLRESLGLKVGVSEGEASVVQHMGDLATLLAPIEKRFGKVKRRHVANFLHLEAQIGLKEDVAERTTDPKLRAEMEAQIAAEKKALDAERSKVGVYVMLYVRSIFPETAWSLWARLGQTLTARHTPRGNLWQALGGRLATATSPDQGLYARLEASIATRAQAAVPTLHHVRELPEAMQHYVHWVMKEIHVTAQHAAAGLGHHEAHAHEMLSHLAARGFLHKVEKDGQVAYRARVAGDATHEDKPHLWHGLTHRLAQHHKGNRT